MPPRRTRTVLPVEDDYLDEAPAHDERRPAAQARRVQAATADPKVRLPRGERAAESANGELSAAIAGRHFRLADSIGLMPLMEWAAAQDEVDTRNASQLLGFYRVLQDLVHPAEWQAFKAFTREHKCDDTDFAAFQNAAMEALAARPTEAPEAS